MAFSTAFQSNAFQNNAFQIAVAVPTAPAPGGVGGRYTGPAFPSRKKRKRHEDAAVVDLQPPALGPPVPDLPPPAPGPEVEDIRPSPLLKLVDAGPIKAARPLVDETRLQQERDDEEAIIALMSHLLH